VIDDYRRIASTVRGIAGAMGVRPYAVALVTNWRGGDFGLEGAERSDRTEIVEGGGSPPRVRQLTDDEVSIGELPQSSFEIGPITPKFSTGGTAWSALQASDAQPGAEVFVELTGPMFPRGARFRVIGLKGDRSLGWFMRVALIDE
jgi:hypothetical protein